MKNIIAWWANNPVAANLLMVGILLAGLLGFMNVEREAFPSFKPNQVNINVPWPGAAPQEVEEQIIIRIEEALNELDGVYRVYATASYNWTDSNSDIVGRTYNRNNFSLGLGAQF